MPGFHSAAIIATIICFVLTLIWLLAPQLLLSMWGVTYSQPVGLVSRRGAALFLCIGVMFFLARNAGPSPARNAIAVGFTAGCLALASLGIFELVNKRANIRILSAVIIELLLAAAFLYHI